MLVTALAALSDVPVVSCGCLGECGSGPNVGVAGRGVVKGVHGCEGACELLESCGVVPRAGVKGALTRKEQGNRALRTGDAVGALESYGAALGLLGDAEGGVRAAVLANRSAALLGLGRAEEALGEANAAVDADPGSSPAWRRKAEAHVAKRETEKAVSALEVVAKLDPRVREQVEKRIRKLERPKWLPF